MERYDDGFAEERQRIERLVEEIIAGEHKIDKLPNSSAGFSGAAQAEYFSKARYHLESDVTCNCGNTFVTGSTKEDIHVEICSKCHPFYTGQQKAAQARGRIDKFNRKYGLNK